jgi:hypothetical protein
VRRIAGEKNTAFVKCRSDALVYFIEIAMDDIIAPGQGEDPLQAGIGRFITQGLFVALFNAGRKHRAPAPLAVVAGDFEKIGPFVGIG